MVQQINYGGYNEAASDYDALDGQLAMSLGLLNEDGTLKPLMKPEVVSSNLGGNYEIVYIHKTYEYTHYILVKHLAVGTPNEKTFFYWMDESQLHVENPHIESLWRSEFDGYVEVMSASAIGNTLVLLTSIGMIYYLWRPSSEYYEDSNYWNLGDHLPELSLSFGLQGHVKESATTSHDVVLRYSSNETYWYMRREDLTDMGLDTTKTYDEVNHDGRFAGVVDSLKNGILADVNKFIADESLEQDRFIFPFFVRYAYRLFDGSLVMHSSPILMLPISTDDVGIVVEIGDWDEEYDDYHGINTLYQRTLGITYDLDYQATVQNVDLSTWKDIIRSVDIFVSAPIYTYDQSGDPKGFARFRYEDHGNTICRFPTAEDIPFNWQSEPSGFYSIYAERPYAKYLYGPQSQWLLDNYHWEFQLPKRDTDDIKRDIEGCSTFYLMKSIDIDNIAAGRLDDVSHRKVIKPQKGFLKYITGLETMTDDYDSHDKLKPQRSFVYNTQLNLAGITKTLAKPNCLANYVNFTNGVVLNYKIFVYVYEGGQTKIIEEDMGTGCPLASCELYNHSRAPFIWFYYPNPNAYKLLVHCVYEDAQHQTYDTTFEYQLKRHEFLNGAYFFEGFEPSPEVQYNRRVYASVNLDVNLFNKLYTSEVGNPFFFPATSINTIGNGTILNISSATKALSEGQFGQFPLYAFTTEGVWALEVGSNGGFSAKQPVSRDVLLDPDSLCQIDNAVLFATQRGIMFLSGSTAKCISDALLNEAPFDITTLPRITELPPLADMQGFEVAPFADFLNGCRMVYDYNHQRIFVFNPERTQGFNPHRRYPYAYVLSLKSMLWGMMESDLRATMNSYPDAQAVNDDYELVNVSQTDGVVCDGLVVTRPLKLSNGDALKTVHTVIQRGWFTKGSVETLLYGSRDLEHWHLLASSQDHMLRHIQGTPYKYFRIVALTALPEGRSLSGATVEMEPRLMNRLR